MIAAVSTSPGLSLWLEVCKLDDLIENIGICALIGDQQVALFRFSGSNQLYAIDNHDPFSDANVLSRGVVGDLNGQPMVASPIFKHHFNLQTGQCMENESVKLKTYAVRVVDGIVQIADQDN